MNINQASYAPKIEVHGDTTIAIAAHWEMNFNNVERPGYRVFDTDGSTPEYYIPPGDHVLPRDAALPMLRATDRWACPSPEKFAEVRKLVEQTSNSGCVVQPGYERFRHLLGLHLGGKQNIGGRDVANFNKTRIEWWQDNWPDSLGGGPRKRGWYFGVLEGRDNNGQSNWHYNRLHNMGLALIYEEDHEKRKAAWPFYIEQAIAYTCFGREWSGTYKGFSKGEKCDQFIGIGADGQPTRSYAKDWVLNLVLPFALTEQAIFRQAMVNAAEFYTNQWLYKWGGDWGSRVPARMGDCMLSLWLVLAEYRWALEESMKTVLGLLKYYLKVDYWPNLGNGGRGPISGWMQSEACVSCLRIYEHLPHLEAFGPSRSELAAVMARVMDTKSGTQGGSEEINGYACVRYRYINDTGEPMVATSLANTAFALPALRMLQRELPRQYENCHELMTLYIGSELSPGAPDVQNGTPFPIDQIGYRFPRGGASNPKTVAVLTDAIR